MNKITKREATERNVQANGYTGSHGLVYIKKVLGIGK